MRCVDTREVFVFPACAVAILDHRAIGTHASHRCIGKRRLEIRLGQAHLADALRGRPAIAAPSEDQYVAIGLRLSVPA
jgi:hypothetical protein